MHGGQRSGGIHSVTRKHAAALLAGVALALAGFSASGCGEDPGPKPRVADAPDRSERISDLKRKVAGLKKQRQDAAAAGKQDGDRNGARNPAGLDSLVAGLPGQAGVAVAGPGGAGPQQTGGPLASGPAWSTIKVPIVERVLEDAGGPSGIDAATRDRITAAITESDNAAAAALFSRLESTHGGLGGASAAVGQMLRAAGDEATRVSTEGRDGFSTYGQTEWSLTGQNRYMAALAGGCVSDPASRDFLLARMAAVGGSDTYGLGSTGLPARWKGGWGPGTDGRYLVRQFGVIQAAGGPIVVSMAAIATDGSFESGQAMLNEIAARVVTHFDRAAPSRQPC